jgi:hypothetical protein
MDDPLTRRSRQARCIDPQKVCQLRLIDRNRDPLGHNKLKN